MGDFARRAARHCAPCMKVMCKYVVQFGLSENL